MLRIFRLGLQGFPCLVSRGIESGDFIIRIENLGKKNSRVRAFEEYLFLVESIRWDNFINGGPLLWRRRAVAWVTKGTKDSLARDLKIQKYMINYNRIQIAVKIRINVTIS